MEKHKRRDKVKKRSMLVVLLFSLVLAACGSDAVGSGLKAGEVKEISYDELVKKLDNEESFLLLSDDLSFNDFKDAGLVDVVNKTLKEYNLGLYYVEVPATTMANGEVIARSESQTGNEDVKKIKNLMGYTHADMKEIADVYNEYDQWKADRDGLVLVRGGGVFIATFNQDSEAHDTQVFSRRVSNWNTKEIAQRVENTIHYRIQKFNEWNLLDSGDEL